MIVELTHTEINSVVLYGSYARGDYVADSDLDVCVFTQEQGIVKEAQLEPLLTVPAGSHLSLTCYCQADLSAMLEYGSLFLWHLKLEGKIIYGKEFFLANLEYLKPFEKHHGEIAYHSEILSDLTAAISTPFTANEFDLSLLFTIVRNTCMILAHKAGSSAFGRRACYHAAARMFPDLPLDEVTYLNLSQWKTVYERGTEVNGRLPSSEEMQRLLAQVQALLKYADVHTR